MNQKIKRSGFLGILVGILGANLLGKMLECKRATSQRGREVIHAGDGVIWGGIGATAMSWTQDFWYHLMLWLILKHRKIIRINPDLMVFIQEIDYMIGSLRMGNI